jgi:hypothetical protein
MRRAKVPAYVSNYAGAYVCNHLMYEALHAIALQGLPTRFAFIHLPLTIEMALPETSGKAIPPSLPLDALIGRPKRPSKPRFDLFPGRRYQKTLFQFARYAVRKEIFKVGRGLGRKPVNRLPPKQPTESLR